MRISDWSSDVCSSDLVEGIHSRTEFDLSQHQKHSGKKVQYFDPELNQSYVPYVIETSIGLDRMFLTVFCNAYTEEQLENDSRVVLKFPPALAPVMAAVLPLTRKDGLPDRSEEHTSELQSLMRSSYSVSC